MKTRYIVIVLIAVAVALAAIAGPRALFSGGPEIEVIHPKRGPIRESFREPARTRLEDTYQIAMQVPGRIGRIELEPGDRVEKGQVLAEYDLVPLIQAVEEAEALVAQLRAQLAVKDDDTLELTALAEAEQRAKGTEESVEAAEARVQSARIRVDYTKKELARIQKLAESGTVSAQALDEARLNFDTAQLELERAQSDLESTRATLAANRLEVQRLREVIARKRIERQEILSQIDQAEAALARATHDLEIAKVISPIDGFVLERYERGERPLALGTQLLLLGRPEDIEVIADVLSEDALRLNPGDEVIYDSGPSRLELSGAVKRIEPQGFTKLSSLGVEQQRVNVISSVDDPPDQLGVGFRLHARYFVGAKENALIVPRFAVMQAPDQTFYVFVVQDGKIERQPVTLGLRSDLEIEIVDGLTEESLVVAAPDTTLQPGSAVRPVLDR